MATRTRSRRLRRRVRRNPPKMTPAMRRKIGAKIRALHRAGKYRRVRRSSSRAVVVRSSPRRRVRRQSARRTSFGRVRRVSRRRRSGGSMMGGGMLGLKSVLRRDILLGAVGALGATFLTNWTVAQVAPRLPSGMGTNPFVRAAIKLAVTGVAAKVASRYSRPVAQGILIGGVLVVANDLIRQYGLPGGTTAAYLGGARRPVAAYLGAGPVSPTNRTYSPGVGNVYQGGSAFKSDAWAR